MKEENIKGITLVALVVTIIILLILVGISIQTIMNTELFTNAKETKNAVENSQNAENSIISSYDKKIKETLTGNREEIKNNEYKEEEKAVGTWIDGKNLYRKVLVKEQTIEPSQTALNIKMGNIENLEYIWDYNIICTNNLNANVKLPYLKGSKSGLDGFVWYGKEYYGTTDTDVTLCLRGENDHDTIEKIYLILEYTKKE